MSEEKTLNLNWNFCLKISVSVIFLYFLYLIKDLVIWFIFALVLSILFNFLIDFLEKKKLPRILATVIVYFGLLIVLSFFLYKTAPIFLFEIKQFSSNLPQYFQKISPYLEKVGIGFVQDSQSFFSLLENNLKEAGGNILNALFTIFGGFNATVFIIFLSFFLSIEKDFLERVFTNFTPEKYRQRLFNLLPRVKKRVSGWFISRVIGVLFVGSLSYLAFEILNIKYSLIFSVVFGVLDFVPIIGPIIAGTGIVLIVMITSFPKALFVLISLVIIQQLENSLLFPILFKKFVGIPAVLVLIALAIGATLWGVLGAILAVPLSGVIFEVIKDYLNLKKKEKEAEIL